MLTDPAVPIILHTSSNPQSPIDPRHRTSSYPAHVRHPQLPPLPAAAHSQVDCVRRTSQSARRKSRSVSWRREHVGGQCRVLWSDRAGFVAGEASSSPRQRLPVRPSTVRQIVNEFFSGPVESSSLSTQAQRATAAFNRQNHRARHARTVVPMNKIAMT